MALSLKKRKRDISFPFPSFPFFSIFEVEDKCQDFHVRTNKQTNVLHPPPVKLAVGVRARRSYALDPPPGDWIGFALETHVESSGLPLAGAIMSPMRSRVVSRVFPDILLLGSVTYESVLGGPQDCLSSQLGSGRAEVVEE